MSDLAKKVFFFLLGLYVISLFLSYTMVKKEIKDASANSTLLEDNRVADNLLTSINNLRGQIDNLPAEDNSEAKKLLTQNFEKLKAEVAQLKARAGEFQTQKDQLAKEKQEIDARINVLKNTLESDIKTYQDSNPFYRLGAYPQITGYGIKGFYNTPQYGILNDDNYCNMVDLYNLANPDNIFKNKVFFTDYNPGSTPRTQVMQKIGIVPMKDIFINMNKANYNTTKYRLDPRINTFFMNYDKVFHNMHKIGSHFLCATQMYNHIPGSGFLVGKEAVLDKLTVYAQKYESKSQCFNKTSFFPRYHRLNRVDECKAFFEIVNTEEYVNSLVEEPIQYLIKIGSGSHMGEGVFVFDEDKRKALNTEYNFGKKCGVLPKNLIAQAYITNPLLLDMDNKFDFRVYVLIASTNPLIVFYHDGFLRVSLSKFEKTSKDRGTHLTNTHLAFEKIEEAKKQKQVSANGLTGDKLLDYHLWSFDRLQDYLLTSGKVKDKNWLNNVLRPKFHKAIAHVVRMTSDSFLKQSNIYELHGMDFMLDDNMNLWFIESNPSPLLTGTTKANVYRETLMDVFEIQYSYFKSRMKRVLDVIATMQQESAKTGSIDYSSWENKYQEAVKNRIEPEYKIKAANKFKAVIDENLPNHEAYFGLISEECYVQFP